MPAVWVFMSIVILIISFIAGFIFFYVTSSLTNHVKKKQLEEITSLLIDFIILIWIGKLILNINVFISDPLAVLAYPSNSKAFYIAVLLLILHIGYQVKRHKFEIKTLLFSFVPVFLVASFVYEFIQIVWVGNTFTWCYLGLLMVLLIIYLIFHDRISSKRITFSLLTIWSLGQLILAMIMPFITVFGYMLSPWFMSLILIFCFILFIKTIERGNHND